MAQKKKSSPKQKPAGKAKPVIGTTSEVAVNATWIACFEKNEQVGEAEKLSDEQISAFMQAEFPGLDATQFKHVNIVRGKYNRGGLRRKDKSGRLVRPKIHSKQYSGLGQVLDGGKQSSNRGGVPGQSATSAHKKDFKSHKK